MHVEHNLITLEHNLILACTCWYAALGGLVGLKVIDTVDSGGCRSAHDERDPDEIEIERLQEFLTGIAGSIRYYRDEKER